MKRTVSILLALLLLATSALALAEKQPDYQALQKARLEYIKRVAHSGNPAQASGFVETAQKVAPRRNVREYLGAQDGPYNPVPVTSLGTRSNPFELGTGASSIDLFRTMLYYVQQYALPSGSYYATGNLGGTVYLIYYLNASGQLTETYRSPYVWP